MTEDHLEKARKELQAYAEESGCGWCKRKAEQLATAASDLKGAMPDAERMKAAISRTKELSNIDGISSEIRTQKERSGRLIGHLEELNRAVREEPRPEPPPTTSSLAVEPPKLLTPDDIAQRDAELYEKYKSVARPRGPIRDRIVFRLYKRTQRN